MEMRADVLVAQTFGTGIFTGAGTQNIVQTPAGVRYFVYIDTGGDVAFVKSTDGLTWSAPMIVFAGTVVALSVCYDRDSGIAAGKIHCAYTDSAIDDTLYRSIDTESADALGTQTTIFAGASTLAGGCLSITRARGGNLVCATMIDAGTEGTVARSVDVGANWTTRATVFEAAIDDQVILVPGFAADTQDIIAFFWDASADEISRKVYDDSADSWAETSIATTMLDQTAANAFPHFSAAVDLTNSKILLVAWSAVDAANADLRCWSIDETTITEKANVVQDSTDDQGLCGISIDTVSGRWVVVYGGKSDGSENFLTAINLYCKWSADAGTTWDAVETKLTTTTYDIAWLCVTQRSLGGVGVAFHSDLALDEMRFCVALNMKGIGGGLHAIESGVSA